MGRFYADPRTTVTALGLAAACAAVMSAQGPPQPGKSLARDVAAPFVDSYTAHPRVVVMTDIANEPDDQMSLVRFLLYSNQFDVEGLVASTSTWMRATVRPDVILSVLDAYETVQPNLLKHAPGFPPAAALREKVAAGQSGYGMAAVGEGKASPGADLILHAAEKDDGRPLWVLAWGGTNTLAQALVSARSTRTPAQLEAIVSRLWVYAISDQDDAGPWLRREFPSLRYVVSPSTQDGQQYYFATWTGISGDRYYRNAPGADFTTFSDDWVNANIRSKGPLGRLYPYPCCIHEGDTPSFLWLVDNGLASAMSPAFGGWGGRYVWRQPSGESRPFWTQGGDSYPGRDSSRDTVTGIDGKSYTSDQATIWRWRTAFQHDFAARMDWTVKDVSEANHPPRVVVNGGRGTEPIFLDALVGTPVMLDAAGTADPDKHALTYTWFFYPEAGTGIPGRPVVVRQRPPVQAAPAPGQGGIPPAPASGPPEPAPRIVIENANTQRATVVPKVAGIAHVILAVEDNGTPSLTSYRRIVFTMKPMPPGGPVPPPVELTAEQDHARLMGLLGITSVRPGADPRNPQAPSAVNYDEAKASPYRSLPDPLVLKNGKRVTNAKTWWERRRPEIVEDFDREVYGRVPKDMPPVRWEVKAVANEAVGGVPVITKTLVGHVDNTKYPALTVDIELALTTPANATGPVPVMMEFGFRMPAGMPRPPRPAGAPPEGPSWQEQLVSKGWGYAVIYPNTIQADNGAGLTMGIIGLANKGQPRKVDDWGALRAWAWGASRALDYFETDRAVNAIQVGIEGLSRYGKAALVAMAYEPRFAIAFVASSGEGGAKLHRRNFGELVENVAGSGEYHWMAGNFIKYAGPLTANDLPVDSHELVALCAPRPVFVSSGSFEVEGGWVDARGMFLGAAGAGPVYRLLGKKDLGTTEFPPIETALISGDIAFRQHRGGHTAGPNWPTFLEFAGRYIKAPPLKAQHADSRAPVASRQKVALTFDDLPVHGALPPGLSRSDIARSVLAALTLRKAPPTFGFVNAKGLEEAPANAEVLQLWRAAGHPLGNHAYSHMDLHANSTEAFEQDVSAGEGTLRTYMGNEDWHWFRFPYLHEGETVEKRREVSRFLRDRGYRVAQVTLNFDDWAFNDPYARCLARNDGEAVEWMKEAYLRRALDSLFADVERARRVFGRDIAHVMLLHLGALQTVMLPRLLGLLEERGFELVTLQEAHSDPAYAVEVDRPFPSGATWLDQVAAIRGLQTPPAPDDMLARLSDLCR